jgi:hypothetical protein
MKDIMFGIITGVMLITYCLFVNVVIKTPEIGEESTKLKNKLFILLLCEMIVMTLFVV